MTKIIQISFIGNPLFSDVNDVAFGKTGKSRASYFYVYLYCDIS